MLSTNPAYRSIFHSNVHNLDFYAPVQDSDYHLSRYISAQAQAIYSACGITKDLLESFLDKMIEICNDKDAKTVRTDVAILANNLKYRTRYPVDEDCALRMGATYVFLENEAPDTILPHWTERKVRMAKGFGLSGTDGYIAHDPELYNFFLTEGVRLTTQWSGFDSPLTDMDYFNKRNDMLQTLTPQ